MEIKIHTHHVELGVKRTAYIEEKFEKLSHLAARIGDESSEIKVELEHEEARKTEDAYRCVATLFVPQDTLRAEARNASLETAVDDVLEKLRSQIERYKDKVGHISQRHA